MPGCEWLPNSGTAAAHAALGAAPAGGLQPRERRSSVSSSPSPESRCRVIDTRVDQVRSVCARRFKAAPPIFGLGCVCGSGPELRRAADYIRRVFRGKGRDAAVDRVVRADVAARRISRLRILSRRDDLPRLVHGRIRSTPRSFEFCENGGKAVAWGSDIKTGGAPEFLRGAQRRRAFLFGTTTSLRWSGASHIPWRTIAASDRYLPVTWGEAFFADRWRRPSQRAT